MRAMSFGSKIKAATSLRNAHHCAVEILCRRRAVQLAGSASSMVSATKFNSALYQPTLEMRNLAAIFMESSTTPRASEFTNGLSVTKCRLKPTMAGWLMLWTE